MSRGRDYLFAATVPCNGCTACCGNDMLILHPELGDDPAQYETEECIHPLTGRPALMLRHKPEGGCVYLAEGIGCTIHGRAPAICKEFDCRRMYLKFTRAERREFIARGMFSRDVFEAGRKRVHTLSPAVTIP